MTVSTEVNQAAYTGNGVTTVFPYTFRILNSANLTVTRIDLLEVETVLALGTDYTVSGAGAYNGGAVTLAAPLPNGYGIIIERDLSAVQETDLRNQGTFFAEVHENVFDYLTMLIQQALGWVGLALKRPNSRSSFYDAKQYRIANLADPINSKDAVNKQTLLKSLADLSTDGSGQFVLQMLASLDVGQGGYLSGWKRKFVLDTVNNIAEYLNSGEITIYEYKNLCVEATVDGVAVLDWYPALTQALKDSATYRKKLRAPGGDYYLSQMPRFTNLDTSGSLTNMSLYSLIGDGKDKTIFWTNSTQSNFLNFYSCKVYLKDFTGQRRGVSLLTESNISLSWLSLGDVTLPDGAVRGSLLSNVRLAQSGVGLQIQHAWDCVFDQLTVQDFGTAAYYVNQHSSDNSNNLLFIRPHAETCRYAFGDISRAFALRNGSGGSNRNHGITLVEPHFEPVNWRCRILDLAYPLHFNVINPLFNRNNNNAYSNVIPEITPITSSDAAPIVYINDGVNTHISGGQIAHIGTQSDSVSAVMKFDGIMKGFAFDGYMDTGKSTRTNLSLGLDISGCVNGMREINLNGATLNSFTAMPSVGSRLRVTPIENLQKAMDFVGEQYIPDVSTGLTGMVLKLVQTNTQDQSTPMTDLLEVYSTGYLRVQGYLGTKLTIAPGAIAGFAVGSGVTNRRGKYGIYGLMNDAQLVCEFFNVPGLQPTSIITGSSVNLSQNIPDSSVTGKLCIYQTTSNNQYITLENRTAATISVSALFWAS